MRHIERLLCICALFIAVILCFLTGLSRADTMPTPTQTVSPTSPLQVYATLGPLGLTIPFQATRLVALYDFVGKTALAGAETPVALLKIDKSSADPWDIDFTMGVVTDEKAKGAPIAGMNLAKQNPSPNLMSLDKLKLGVFAGYNANAGNGTSKPIMAGVKMAYELRFW